jgi:S1-C subfamily serine protease
MFGKRSLWFIGLSLAVIIGVVIGAVAAFGIAQQPTNTAHARQQITENDTLFSEIYQRVSPSVVAINVVARQAGTGSFGQDNQVIGAGSGFVIDTDGHILTNNHVVEGATSIEVNFFDGTIARGDVVGTDPDSDLAVVHVDVPAGVLQPVEFGDSDALMVGQGVLAIGSPFNQRWTLTSGIISALQRTISAETNFSIGGVIQTDASINPGNSGGPLIDLDGRVIGVNSQIITRSEQSSGVGFAVPSNLAQRVAQQLIESGSVQYSYLGISGGDVSLAMIEAFNLPANQRGVVVGDVSEGGPAAQAGLKSAGEITGEALDAVPTTADIITAIDGQPINSMADLISYLARNTQPGQTVTLNVLRDGKDQLQLQATLAARPVEG